MKKIVFVFLLTILLLPTTTFADSATRDMASVKLIDKATGKEPKDSEGIILYDGDLNIRCYGYKWKELGMGGFDQEKPKNYTPEEVYTITEHYRGENSLMDLTHYIKFKTIDYCDLEVEFKSGEKYVAREYNDWPVFEDSCKNNHFEFEGLWLIDRICRMEIEVEKVDKFDWEDDYSTNTASNLDCPKTSCPIVNVDENNEDNNVDNTFGSNSTTRPMGMWGWFRCLIVGLLGGKC